MRCHFALSYSQQQLGKHTGKSASVQDSEETGTMQNPLQSVSPLSKQRFHSCLSHPDTVANTSSAARTGFGIRD